MRIGHLSKEDIAELNKHVIKTKCESVDDIANEYMKLKKELKPDETICALFATCQATNDFNRTLLTLEGVKTESIQAEDKWGAKFVRMAHKQLTKESRKRGGKPRNIKETGGLEETLVVGVGATVSYN